MIAVLDETAVPTTTRDNDGDAELASWAARAGAFGFDVLSGVAVLSAFVLLALSSAQQSWLWWVGVASTATVFLALAINRWLVPALTGWSVGRVLFGIAVADRDGGAVGPWRLLTRDFAHLLDTLAVGLGWVLPLWDSRRRTFADILVRTEVRRVTGSSKRARRYATCAVAVAVSVALAAATLSYVVVYRPDFTAERAREQLAVQGPKIVTDVLSYQPATLEADFDRARALVTDGYRPQLVAQQQAVPKTDVVDNEYWATNAAVLWNTEKRGEMLVLLQGQRGVAPGQRTITATVRAAFEKSGDQWRMAGVTVLAEPRPESGPK